MLTLLLLAAPAVAAAPESAADDPCAGGGCEPLQEVGDDLDGPLPASDGAAAAGVDLGGGGQSRRLCADLRRAQAREPDNAELREYIRRLGCF
jgi:hypothetical protein